MKYKSNESTYILANFPLGATVNIDIYNLATDTKVVTAGVMSQVSTTKIFKYSFSNTAGEYLWIATDGVETKMGKIIVGSSEDRIDDIHKIHGLDVSNPLSVSASARTTGGISQTISGTSTVTVTRS